MRPPRPGLASGKLRGPLARALRVGRSKARTSLYFQSNTSARMRSTWIIPELGLAGYFRRPLHRRRIGHVTLSRPTQTQLQPDRDAVIQEFVKTSANFRSVSCGSCLSRSFKVQALPPRMRRQQRAGRSYAPATTGSHHLCDFHGGGWRRGHGEFVAHFECNPSRLRVADMMGVGWGATADDTWLLGDEAKVIF